MAVEIRPITAEDAGALVELFQILDRETSFLLYEPGERTTGADPWREIIEGDQHTGVSMMWVAVAEGDLVGFLRARGETLRRVRHIVTVIVAVRQAFVGQGIGTRLFQAMEEWARQRGIRRLTLAVMAHNQRGISLYKKMGFEVEGVHRQAIFVDGAFRDEYTMAKYLV